MKQVVKKATRITERSKTIIDLVMSSMNMEAELLMTDKISDHSTVQIKIDELVCKRVTTKTVKKLVDYTPVKFKQLLAEYDWDSLLDESVTLNEKSDSLNRWLVDTLQSFVKEVRVTARSAKKWFDEELSEMRKKKEKLYASAVMERSSSNWKYYRSWRNSYLTAIRNK